MVSFPKEENRNSTSLYRTDVIYIYRSLQKAVHKLSAKICLAQRCSYCKDTATAKMCSLRKDIHCKGIIARVSLQEYISSSVIASPERQTIKPPDQAPLHRRSCPLPCYHHPNLRHCLHRKQPSFRKAIRTSYYSHLHEWLPCYR